MEKRPKEEPLYSRVKRMLNKGPPPPVKIKRADPAFVKAFHRVSRAYYGDMPLAERRAWRILMRVLVEAPPLDD